MWNRGKKDKKKEEQQGALEEKYGLKDLDDIDLEILQTIKKSMANANLMTFGMDSDGKVNQVLLESLIEQNFMIIRLLQDINEKLDK